jgi:uncharacterized delta-60 repeat protein
MAINHSPTFNVGDGIVTTTWGGYPEEPNDVAVQGDGRIVVAGNTLISDVPISTRRDFALVRFNADGSLDTTFGGDGKVMTDFGDTEDFGKALRIQADGRIVLTGYQMLDVSDADFALARYTVNGALDATFSGDGRVTADFGDYDVAYDLAVQSDGRIVLAGGVGLHDWGLARFNADGTPDTSFGDEGQVRTTFVADDIGFATAVRMQADGKIVAAGLGGGIGVARYNADGSLDSTFGGDGMASVVVPSGIGSWVNDMILQADGRILVVGWSGRSGATDSDMLLVRFNANGSLDTTFGGGDGIVLSDFFSGNDDARDVVVQAGGRIVVGGAIGIGGTSVGAGVRYTPDGSLDGVVLTYPFVAPALVILPEAGFVAGGGDATGIGASRLLADGSFDPTFDPVRMNTLGGTATYTVGGAPVVLDTDVRAYDPDLFMTHYGGASLTLVRHGGANSQDVFSAAGELAPLTQGNSLMYDGVVVGTVTANSAGRLALRFNSNATQGYVDEVLQSIAYANTSGAPPSSLQLDWTFSDGNTGAQGTGGASSVVGTTTVTMNHAPAITSNGGSAAASITINENGTGVTTVTASDADQSSGLVYSIVGGADASRFSINTASGALRFVAAPDFEHPNDAGANNVYDVIVGVRDSAGATDTQSIAVRVGNVVGLTVTGGSGNDRLNGSSEEDTLSGAGGDDAIYANAGNDRLSGGAGTDHLFGGVGADALDGGTGFDYARYDYAAAPVLVDLWANRGLGEALGDTFASIEAVVGSRFADTLAGDDNANVLVGNDGDDHLSGGEGADTLRGGNNYDGLDGGYGNDSLFGDAGNDRLRGGPGSDDLYGGAGADRFVYGSTADGIDTVRDFTRGAGGDQIHIADVLVGYTPGSSNINDFVRLTGTSNTTVLVNADGTGTDFFALAVLQGVANSPGLLQDMITNGNLFAG